MTIQNAIQYAITCEQRRKFQEAIDKGRKMSPVPGSWAEIVLRGMESQVETLTEEIDEWKRRMKNESAN